MNISVMNSKDNWNIFSKNRNAIYGVAIISIMIFHFFEDIVILSILVDTFISKISFPMQPGPEIGSISDA